MNLETRSKVSNSVEKYSIKNKTEQNFNSNRTSSNRTGKFKNREASLSFQKINNKVAKKKFYDNILAIGGRHLINPVEMKLNNDPSNTLNNIGKPLISNDKINADKINWVIPISDQNKKCIENLNSAVKARKTFRQFEWCSNLISPRIKVDDDYKDYNKTTENNNTVLASPTNQNLEFYSIGRDRVYLREISLGSERFSIK